MLKNAKDLSLATEAMLRMLGAIRQPATPPTATKGLADKGSSIKTIRLLTACLSYLDPDCDYGVWFTVCCILFNVTHGSEDGYHLFNQWSSMGRKYKGNSETLAKWKSVKPDHCRPVGLATLRRMVELEGADWLLICCEAEDPFFDYRGGGAR
jgi:hypothetical protein